MFRDALLWIRTALISIPAIVLATVAAATLALFAAANAGAVQAIRLVWARAVLAAAFVRVRVEGANLAAPASPRIYCANHLSYLDPPVLIATLPTGVRVVAKKSLFRVPFLGWGMWLAGDISLDRDDPRVAARSLAQAAERVRRGQSLLIFPEGGRSPDGAMQPFLSGAFRLAIAAGAPVVPVAISGTRRALRPGSLLLRGGEVRITFGEPVPAAGLARREHDALREQVERSIRRMLEQKAA
jgi:1-acyl-sn-glycerol-3-phosphate acyltransferase